MIHRSQYTDFVECVLLLFLSQLEHFYLLERIDLSILDTSHLENRGVSPIAKLFYHIKITQGISH